MHGDIEVIGMKLIRFAVNWGAQVAKPNQAYSDYKYSLALRVRRYLVTAAKPVYRLQIRPVVHS